jgi:hypothetical protein
MAKGKRGPKFTIAEIESLLEVIDEIVPIGNPKWERVWDMHSSCYPGWEQTAELLRCKFQQLAWKKMPTGDLTFPPYICSAKCIYRKIVRATDGLDGGSDDEDKLGGNNADDSTTKTKTTWRRERGGGGTMIMTMATTEVVSMAESRAKITRAM